jgi:tetratricopeptide (TPR) repeat protein
MDAVTYPSREVAAFIRDRVVSLRLSHDHKPLSDELGITRTPCLVLLDNRGAEHHRITGFQTPEDLLAAMQLGLAKIEYDRGVFGKAAELLDRLLAVYPGNAASPEAIYVRGLSRYKERNEPIHLKRAYEQLKSDFPRSEWTRRTFPYRLL